MVTGKDPFEYWFPTEKIREVVDGDTLTSMSQRSDAANGRVNV